MVRPSSGISPRIHPTAFIDASAPVIGDVEIGEESGDVRIDTLGTVPMTCDGR